MNGSKKIEIDEPIRQSDECAYQLINGVMVIVSPREREIHRLDEVGTSIWQWLEQGSTIGKIARNLAEEYDVGHDAAVGDVSLFAGKLLQKKLIVFSD